jgi:hypothetical protein
VDPRTGMDEAEKRETFLLPPRIEPRSPSPYPSHCADRAIVAPLRDVPICFLPLGWLFGIYFHNTSTGILPTYPVHFSISVKIEITKSPAGGFYIPV